MIKILVILLALGTSGCVGLPFNPFSDDGGIEVEAQIGKTNERTTGVKSDELVVGSKTTAEYVVEDTKFGTIKATTVTVDEQVPVWVWLLMILGWLLPSPREIYRGLGKLAWGIRAFLGKSKG